MQFRKRTNPTTAHSSRPLRAFLCHASGDKPAVRKLYRWLRSNGVEPWLDEENLLPGQDWQREIPIAVRESDVVIVCLSRGSITKTGYVQKEIKHALDIADLQPEGTIFIIPAKLEECEVHDRLNHLHWVNLFEKSGYSLLLRTLQRISARLESVGVQQTTVDSTQLSASQEQLSAHLVQAISHGQASQQSIINQKVSTTSRAELASSSSWNDHPLVVTIVLLAAVVAIIVFVTGHPSLPAMFGSNPTAKTPTPEASVTAVFTPAPVGTIQIATLDDDVSAAATDVTATTIPDPSRTSTPLITPSGSGNLLMDASFERTGALKWSKFDNSGVSHTAYREPGRAKEGIGFMEMNTSRPGGSIFQDVALPSAPPIGKSYTFSIWLRSPDGSPFTGVVSLWGLGGTNESASTRFTVGPEWTLVSTTLDIAYAGHAALRAEIHMETTGRNLNLDVASLTSRRVSGPY